MKMQHYFFLSFLLFTIVSCTVDVPDEEYDTQEPQFSFTVEGDGFSHTFTESDDFDSFQLNLKQNVDYDFTFSGSDDEALNILQWNYPSGLSVGTSVWLSDELPEGWRKTNRYQNTPYGDSVVFEGNNETPVTHTELQGQFSIYSGFDDLTLYHYFSVTNFDAANDDEHISEGRLRINLVSIDQPTELVYIND